MRNEPFPSQFGFIISQLLSVDLDDTSGPTSFNRPNGVYEVAVIGSITAIGGGASVGIFLDGTLDGTNWTTLAQTDPSDELTVNGTSYALGFNTASWVSIGRFSQLRVRAIDSTGGGTFTMAARVSGVMHVGTGQYPHVPIVRTGVANNSTPYARANGVRQCTIQASFSAVVRGGVTSFDVVAQASTDGLVWADVSDPISMGSDGAQSFIMRNPDGTNCIDLGGFSHVRLRVYDVGGAPGVNTAYAGTIYYGSDTGDWVAYESPVPGGGGGGGVATAARAEITMFSDGQDVTDVVDIQLTDSSGIALAGNYDLVLVASDTQYAGDVDLSANGQWGAIVGGFGAVIAGAGTNRVAVRTNGTGHVRVQLATTFVGVVIHYVSAYSSGVPNSTGSGLVVTQTDEVAANYV